MITAVDTNILLDILISTAPHRDASLQLLETAHLSGSTVICETVYSELAARFIARADFDGFLDDSGVAVDSATRASLHAAGRRWAEYLQRRSVGISCQQCGATQQIVCRKCDSAIRVRQHVLADFTIGAHAATQADRLLTRDKGYYSTYFPELTLA